MSTDTNIITLNDARKAHEEAIQWAELRRDGMIDRLSVWGPMLIPMIPATLSAVAIGMNYHSLLHFNQMLSWPIGLISGAGIEVFGIVANENYLDMQRYNQTLQEGEERAPEEEARKARNTYMSIVIGLMATLEAIPMLGYAGGWPQWISTVSVLSSLFPLVFLAVLSGQVIIMRKQHKARVNARHDREQAITEAKVDSTEQLRDQLTERDRTITELNSAVQSIAANMNAFQVTVNEQFSAVHGFMNGLTEQVSALHEQAANVQAGHDSAGVNEAVQSIIESLNKLNERMNNMGAQVVNEQPKNAQRKPEQPKSTQSKAEQNTDKAERQKAVFEYISAHLNGEVADKLNKSEIAKAMNANRVTIGRDIDELIKLGRLSVNGHINVVA